MKSLLPSDNTESNASIIERLADKYGIVLVSAAENARMNGEWRNNMACAGSTIFLNEFDDPDIELAAFFHELGHVECGRSPYFHQHTPLCKMSQESLAWEVGLSIAAAEGYHWDYHSKQLKYARQCLISYIHNHGELGGFE